MLLAVVISEFMASNDAILADENGDYPDWIELHNSGAAAVDLTGWFLTDDSGILTKWRFPAVSLAADAHLVVFASDKDRRDPGATLHTNFKLDSDGEYLALVRPDGATVEDDYAPTYPPQETDTSYGTGLGQQIDTLVDVGAAARFLVPTDSNPAGDWRTIGFDDSAWTPVTQGIGYQTVAGAAATVPVGYWSFDDTPNDASGSGHHAALAGAAGYSSLVPPQLGTGKSLNLNGTAGTYAIVHPLDVSETAFSVSFWFRGTTTNRGLFSVAAGNLGVGGQDRSVFLSSSNVAAQLKGGESTETIVSSNQNYVDGNWHHLVYTFAQGATGQRIYVDGVQRAAGSQSVSLRTDQDRIYIGYSPPGLNDYWSGQIDDLAVFNSSLSAGQAAALFGGANPLDLSSYQADLATDVGAAMNGVNATSYLRIGFQVADTGLYDGLKLKVKYDDGLVVYLNGVEVARRNAPAVLAWNSTATAPHFNHLAVAFEDIDLSAQTGLLQNGANVLAIQGLNVTAADGDFLLAAQLVDEDLVGPLEQYYAVPSPGAANNLSGVFAAADPEFSLASTAIVADTAISLTTATPGATIHYTTNGSEPTASSPTYSGPITVSSSVQLRARAFKNGFRPSRVASQAYTRLAPDVLSVSSNLPIVVINTFGTNIVDENLRTSYVSFYDANGKRNLLTDAPGLSTRAGIAFRGSASLGFPQKQYRLETWDETNADKRLSILGMPLESDWILDTVYNEKSLLQNTLGYELSRQMGHYAARTQYVEVYVDTNGGNLTAADYAGIYVFAERIDIGKDRVDIEQLGPSDTAAEEISGGYLLKNDRNDDKCASFISTAGGQPICMVEPEYSQATAAQRSYITDYFNQFESALRGANYTDPALGYAAYLDVDSWVDNHIQQEFAKNIDGFRINQFFYKDRGGKLQAGPVWDFSLSMGNANYLTGWNPSGWYAPLIGGTGYPYYQRLFTDPNFQQRYIDRWAELRDSVLSDENVQGIIIELAEEFNEAQARHHARWGRLGVYDWPNIYYGQGDLPQRAEIHPARTWRDEVTWVGQFLHDRARWFDSQWLPRPALSQSGGAIAAGFQLTIAGSSIGTVYYTLDGSDPRASGGGLSPSAVAYTGPITLNSNTRVVARLKNDAATASLQDDWSAPTSASFAVEAPALIVSEIMYNPAEPSSGSFLSSDLEYLEVQNVGTTPINLQGFRFSRGVSFTFPSAVLDPGQAGVVARNAAAFAAHYPGVTPLGEFTDSADAGSGALNNDGERVTLEDNLGIVLFDAPYDNRLPHTAGLGFSLVTTYESPGGGALYNSGEPGSRWRASQHPGGNPGAADTGPQLGSVVINEVNAGGGSDWIELYNTSNQPVDLGGWYLSDDPGALTKYRIAAGTVLSAGGYLVFTAAAHFGNPGDPGTQIAFDLDELGESVSLSSPSPGGVAGGYRDLAVLGAAPAGFTTGRFVKPDGRSDFVLLASGTPGAANAAPVISPVAISEIMHHPAESVLWLSPGTIPDEFIEIHNTSAAPVELFDPAQPANTWRFTAGVEFSFPTGQTLAAGARALVVPTDPGAFRAKYSTPLDVPIYGPYSGHLDDGGETVELAQPGTPSGGEVPYFRADRVAYDDDLPWSALADGVGSSLARIDDTAYGNFAGNWAAGHAGGSPGAANSAADLTEPDQIPVVQVEQTGIGTADPRNVISWTAVSDAETGVAYYKIYRTGSSIASNYSAALLVGASTTTSFSDNTVIQGPRFRYQVSAVNGDGVEGPLSPLEAIPPTANDDEYTVRRNMSLVTVGTPDVPTVLLPSGSTWKYLDNGTDQGAAWRAAGFDDSSWASGPAQLGYGEGDEATVVSYGPNVSAKYVTTYFRREFTVSNALDYSLLRFQVKRDDGVAIYLNGQEVVRDLLPGTMGDNAVQYNTLASLAFDDGQTFIEYSVDASALQEGTNLIAVEIHQRSQTDSDVSFDLSLAAIGRRSGLLSNDSDPESDPLAATRLTDPAHGQITEFHPDGTFTYVPDLDYVGTDSFSYRVSDPDLNESSPATVTIRVVAAAASSTVAARHVFYNNSAWDGNDPAAGPGDDAAIATDKTALLPGNSASFAHYTSYSAGINGLMIDVLGSPGALTADDFQFRVGNNNAPNTWTPLAAAPTIGHRIGAGVGGSLRVTLTWPDGTIAKQWLQVTVRSTANNGLAAPDVFYFGNAIGEIGNSTTDAVVNAVDEIGARLHPVGPFPNASVTDVYDFNRDRLVDAADQIVARISGTNPLTALRLISVPTDSGGGSASADKWLALVWDEPPGEVSRRRRR